MRDIQRTGQNPRDSIGQITTTVYPMYKAFIEPDLKSAHIRISNSFNPFKGLMTPMFSLKSQCTVTEETILEVLSARSESIKVKDQKCYDIYLHPPGEQSENCVHWIRMRNEKGHYVILFSELIKEGNFLISPRIEFGVDARTLGGMMALGYNIGARLNRRSRVYSAGPLDITVDHIQQLGKDFIQIKSSDRELLNQTAEALGITEFTNKSYIELYIQNLKDATESSSSSSSSAVGVTAASPPPCSVECALHRGRICR